MKTSLQSNRHVRTGVRLARQYSAWASSQAKNGKDLLVLGLGPIVALAVMLCYLPAWLGITLGVVLLVPALYIVFLVLKAYATLFARK